MIKEIEENIKFRILDAMANFNLVSNYRNEFANNSEWIPQFPCALIRVDSIEPDIEYAAEEVISWKGSGIIYVGVKDSSGLSSGELSEQIFDVLDRKNSRFSDLFGEKILSIRCTDIKFFDSDYGVSVYTVGYSMNITRLI